MTEERDTPTLAPERPAAAPEPQRPAPILTSPRGNQEIEQIDLERGEDKLFRICGN
jgi:hypothetical protein